MLAKSLLYSWLTIITGHGKLTVLGLVDRWSSQGLFQATRRHKLTNYKLIEKIHIDQLTSNDKIMKRCNKCDYPFESIKGKDQKCENCGELITPNWKLVAVSHTDKNINNKLSKMTF